VGADRGLGFDCRVVRFGGGGDGMGFSAQGDDWCRLICPVDSILLVEPSIARFGSM